MNKSREIFESQSNSLILKYPQLSKSSLDGLPIVKGMLDIVDQNGKYWQTFEIEIHCTNSYPNRFPSVYEVSNKIPKIADWHMYEDTLACCIGIVPEEIIRCKNGIMLLDFYEEAVIPYFFNQTHRMVEGYYVNGEYEHGLAGILQYYTELFMNLNSEKVLGLLIKFLKNGDLGRTSQCFCGSREKMRKCHKSQYYTLMQIGRDNVKEHVSTIIHVLTKTR
ncbi:hypothetical protein [Chitinophaga sp. LS1]|nr:hypothetical protein [Chitinophaga sp. LS1]WPV66926.1 hypothetical protein QQL36_34605 [Chitinophaga sp. LS1]